MSQQSDYNSNAGGRGTGYLIAVRTAWVAGLFSAVVVGVLATVYLDREVNAWDQIGLLFYGDITPKAGGPLDTPEYARLKAQLAEKPNDEALKEEIRQLDHALRQKYFRQVRLLHVGSHLLLLGLVVLIVSTKTAVTLRQRLPDPGPATTPVDRETPENRHARWTVAGVAVVLIGVSALLTRTIRPDIPHPDTARAVPATPGSQPVRLGPPPSAKEIARYWPRFRGPSGSGISAYENLPLEWDAASGKNIVWKTPVPLPGNNSPVVWGDRVFLTGADKKNREVYCFDATTGELLWNRPIPGTPQSTAQPPDVTKDTGYAAPTAATDSRAVFAMFANGDVTALDYAGTILWTRSLGIPVNVYGHAASLLLDGDRLIIQFDQGSDEDRMSKLLALDVASGETVWSTARDVANSWATPLLIDHAGRRQILTASSPWVIGYAPEDGKELWRAKCITGDEGVSPVFADGLLQVGNEYCDTWSAVRVDGQGDVTKTHVTPTAEDGLPDTVSPLVLDGLLLLVDQYGVMTCHDAKTGKLLWEEEFGTPITSSPGAVGKHVYVLSKKGHGWIIEPTRAACRRVAENDLAEPCVTSPAFQDGRIYVRGKKHLFCIGEGKGPQMNTDEHR
ncbi:MAG: PQQ-binding-like beta-propeller repeat protein [Pirellulales bacterium]|nr:PQQ-binding-like beta-propeller repeat protein [Pirellulales bacterium]